MEKHVSLSLNEKFDTFFNLPNHHSLSIQIDRIHEFVSSEEAKESPKIGELCTLGTRAVDHLQSAVPQIILLKISSYSGLNIKNRLVESSKRN